jgi:SAM-dependent methyltransferase
MSDRPTQKEFWGGKAGDEWAAHADRLDVMMGGLTDAALTLADVRPGERILDIGCGAGATSIAIARRVMPEGSVVGVDISPQLLAVARRRASGLAVAFVEADAATAALNPDFDAAFSRFGVMFFDDPVAAFAHLRTRLRAGGRLVFLCWRALQDNVWATAPIEALRPMLRSAVAPPDPDAPGPFAFADRGKIERILSEAGWRDIAVKRHDSKIPIGGGGSLAETAEFLLRIGPCARAIAEQSLDPAAAKQRLIDHLAPSHRDGGVALAASCWLVAARA